MSSQKTTTVLIVDDDEPTQKLLQAVMRRVGLESIVAPNGHVAIELLDSQDGIACVILDLMMPSVDGAAVVAHLAAGNRPVPVIVCTAVGPRHTPQFDPAIVRAVVRKPFDVEQLTNAVMEIVNEQDSGVDR